MTDLSLPDETTFQIAQARIAAQKACRDDGGHVFDLVRTVEGVDVLECVACGAIHASAKVRWFDRSQGITAGACRNGAA